MHLHVVDVIPFFGPGGPSDITKMESIFNNSEHEVIVTFELRGGHSSMPCGRKLKQGYRCSASISIWTCRIKRFIQLLECINNVQGVLLWRIALLDCHKSFQSLYKVPRCRLAGIIHNVVWKTFWPFWMILTGNQCVNLQILVFCITSFFLRSSWRAASRNYSALYDRAWTFSV